MCSHEKVWCYYKLNKNITAMYIMLYEVWANKHITDKEVSKQQLWVGISYWLNFIIYDIIILVHTWCTHMMYTYINTYTATHIQTHTHTHTHTHTQHTHIYIHIYIHCSYIHTYILYINTYICIRILTNMTDKSSLSIKNEMHEFITIQITPVF